MVQHPMRTCRVGEHASGTTDIQCQYQRAQNDDRTTPYQSGYIVCIEDEYVACDESLEPA
jgi:hypothetical protein